MATPLTDAINALTTYANSVTGASDTTLSDAVDTLVDGYGGGGGGGLTYETGTLTISDSSTRGVTINHTLGVVPKIIYMICRDLTSTVSVAMAVGVVGVCLGSGVTVYVTTAQAKTNGVWDTQIQQKADGTMVRVNITSSNYGIVTCSETTVHIVTTASNAYYKPGTYDWILIA